MKIALPLDENQQEVCVSFGRAPFFMIYDSETATSVCIDNPAAQAQGGAGLLAAQTVVDSGATVLITVRCGENAAQVLQAAEVGIYKPVDKGVQQAIHAYLAGDLVVLDHFHAGFHGVL